MTATKKIKTREELRVEVVKKITFKSTEVSIIGFPFDLHVLSTPPAFILSQDQTL